MNRAFTKEADGDQPSDLPELPISPHRNYVTANGLAQLRERLSSAQARAQEAPSDAVGGALERAHAEREARWLQARIASAVAIDGKQQPRDRVAFGASVDVVDETGTAHTYRIVGEDEADPEHGLVSWVSPLARALIEAQVDDTVIWKRPIGDLSIEVRAIRYQD
jgi:transcription elongation factor GreB